MMMKRERKQTKLIGSTTSKLLLAILVLMQSQILSAYKPADLNTLNYWMNSNRRNNAVFPVGYKANLTRAYLREADLTRAKLGGADLTEANLRDADLREADLREANLMGADLMGANLIGADLSWAYLSKAYLSKADLSGANLTEANLRDADLREADLRGANLMGADLSRANLTEANLTEANLSGANLTNITIDKRTKTEGIKGISQEKLNEIRLHSLLINGIGITFKDDGFREIFEALKSGAKVDIAILDKDKKFHGSTAMQALINYYEAMFEVKDKVLSYKYTMKCYDSIENAQDNFIIKLLVLLMFGAKLPTDREDLENLQNILSTCEDPDFCNQILITPEFVWNNLYKKHKTEIEKMLNRDNSKKSLKFIKNRFKDFIENERYENTNTGIEALYLEHKSMNSGNKFAIRETEEALLLERQKRESVERELNTLTEIHGNAEQINRDKIRTIEEAQQLEKERLAEQYEDIRLSAAILESDLKKSNEATEKAKQKEAGNLECPVCLRMINLINSNITNSSQPEDDGVRDLCMQDMVNPTCGHMICKYCLARLNPRKCPNCRNRLSRANWI
ncbi:pentapeptide repeat-containing protein [Candidatus Babeliales bacterium]|nr:pentapeptide repeat-containing protein [Candidatus Babeliales bacterium]